MKNMQSEKEAKIVSGDNNLNNQQLNKQKLEILKEINEV